MNTAATFLFKLKALRGGPANAAADIQADTAISTWQEPHWKGGTVKYKDRKSTWNSRVPKAIRRGSAEKEVHKHRDRVTGAWNQISKQRR